MTVHDPLGRLTPGPYKVRTEDFLLLDRSGAFDRHAKTELLAGEIFYTNVQHRPHARVKMRLYDAFRESLGTNARLTVMVETSVALSEHDAPEPDLVLTTDPDGDGLIPGASVMLVIEVSDATLKDDLGRKLAIYAAAGVPEYWVADVNARVIHQMWSPADDGYSDRREVKFGDRIVAASIDGVAIDTEAL